MVDTSPASNSIDDDEDVQRQKQITERVALIISNLLSAHYQNRWSDVGLRQVINRMFMLLQRRYVIVVLEHREESDIYRILHHTCLDPFWKDSFESFIHNLYGDFIPNSDLSNDIIVVDKSIASDKNKSSDSKTDGADCFEVSKIDDYLFKFYGNEHFMFHEVHSTRDNDLNTEVDIRTFPPVPIKSNDFLSSLNNEFQRFFNDKRMASFLKNEAINKKILIKAEDWTNRKISRKVLQNADLEKYWPEEDKDLPKDKDYESKYFGNYFNEIKSVFDHEYKAIRESPLLVGRYGIPNVFFSIRMFSQRKLRFSGGSDRGNNIYPYGVRLVIPAAQRIDLKNGFEQFKKDCCVLVPEDRPRIRDAKGQYIDGYFWEKLVSEGGIEEILDTLESPCGYGVRGLSDSLYESDYIQVKNAPFFFGATNRLDKYELDQGYKSKDYCLAVYFHYMLLMLYVQRNNLPAHEFKEANFHVLLAPGDVGGSPLFCTGFPFKLSKIDDKESEEEHRVWIDNLAFYNFIRHNFIRSVRNNIKRLYLKKVEEIYSTTQDKLLDQSARKKTFSPKAVCDLLNYKFRVLSRVYPLGLIEFEVVPNKRTDLFSADHKEEQQDERLFYIRYAGGSTPLAVFVRDNPFFQNYIDNTQFLKSSRIEEYLQSGDRVLRGELLKKMVYYKEKSDRIRNNRAH